MRLQGLVGMLNSRKAEWLFCSWVGNKIPLEFTRIMHAVSQSTRQISLKKIVDRSSGTSREFLWYYLNTLGSTKSWYHTIPLRIFSCMCEKSCGFQGSQRSRVVTQAREVKAERSCPTVPRSSSTSRLRHYRLKREGHVYCDWGVYILCFVSSECARAEQKLRKEESSSKMDILIDST